MLTEIYCDKFKTGCDPDGKGGFIRPAIRMHQGLNVVEGDDEGSNSIGKSTFLMAIDFCFGGNDYVEELKDVMRSVGPHTIFFTFEFGGVPHRFARKTDEKDFVYLCEPGYIITDKKVPIGRFCDFLKNSYGIGGSSLTFRAAIGRFMRIYNRENLDEHLPFREHKNESDSESLTDMLKLYGLYEAIREYDEASKEASDKYKTVGKAGDYKFIPKITDSDYAKNAERIKELRSEAETLLRRNEGGVLELDAEKAEMAAKIKSQISALKKERWNLSNQLRSYRRSAEFEPKGLTGDFSGLTDYFDNVNVPKLEEIEQFHKSVTSMLRTEIRVSTKAAEESMNSVNEEIRRLEAELADIVNAPSVTAVAMKSYADIRRQIEELERANRYHEEAKRLGADSKEKSKDYESRRMVQLNSLVAIINAEMEEITEKRYGNDTNAPVIEIPSAKKYVFDTPNDQGTGCRYKSMITLDASVLLTSCLPVLTHDSLMFVQMSYERVEKTFELYSQQDAKQIFVAVDRTTNLSDEAKKTIADHRILTLAPKGNQLFGWYWGNKKIAG